MNIKDYETKVLNELKRINPKFKYSISVKYTHTTQLNNKIYNVTLEVEINANESCTIGNSLSEKNLYRKLDKLSKRKRARNFNELRSLF